MASVLTVVFLVGTLVGQYNMLSYAGFGGAIVQEMPNMEVCQQVRNDIISKFKHDSGIDSNYDETLSCKTYYVNNGE